MKYILLASLILFASCQKTTFRETVITVTMQHDADNMPINYGFNCYKTDYQYSYDSDFIYNTMRPDTLNLKHYLRVDSHFKTGRIDSSFVSFDSLVILTGPIEHREYTFVSKIKKIIYGEIN